MGEALSFRKELEHLLNQYSMENTSGTPDYILAEYLSTCLEAFERATIDRDAWHAPEGEP